MNDRKYTVIGAIIGCVVGVAAALFVLQPQDIMAKTVDGGFIRFIVLGASVLGGVFGALGGESIGGEG